MLLLCSASYPRSPISFHVGATAFSPLQEVIEDRHAVKDRLVFSVQDASRAQEIRTHSTKCMHSLVLESPDQSCSLDSSILSPYPNEFNEFARGFSKDYFDIDSENSSYHAGNINISYPIDGKLNYAQNLNISETEVLRGDFGSGSANEVGSYGNLRESMKSSYTELTPNSFSSRNELINLSDTLGQSSNALSQPISVPLSPSNSMSSTTAESSVPITDTIESTKTGLSDLKENIEHFLSEMTGSVGMQLDKAEGAAKNTYNTFTRTASDTIKSLTKSFDDVINGLFSLSDSTKEQAANKLPKLSSKLEDNMSGGGILAVDFLRRTIVTLEDSLANAATFVVYSYGSAKSLLPLNVRDALNLSEGKVTEILRPIGASLQQVYIVVEGIEKTLGLDPNDPIVPFILFIGSSATLGVSFWLFNYGGYSGDLTPEVTMELLKKDKNSVLIDVRPEDSRKRDGIPDLRRGTRSKYASVTLPEVDSSVRKMLKGGKEIDNALTAVVIRNLKVVRDVSKVVVMDESGGSSKSIARFLKKLGVKKPYLVQGGFQSWVKKGIRIKELKPETTLSVLNEEAEAILEDIKPTPALVIGYGLGISVALYSLLEWEKTLQVIGIIGLGQSLYRRVASYEDSEDFKKDASLLLAPVRASAQAISWAARRLEPNKVGLPTSPSSSAVQDRVLQAAAKHESQPSDSKETQGLTEA